MEEIDLKELLTFIKEKIWIIITVLLITITISVIYVYNIKKPIYKSSTTYIMISNMNNELQGMQNGITTTDITLNEKLIETYKEVIKSRNILEKTIARLGLTGTLAPETLSHQISVQQISTSSMIKITVTDTDPHMAQRIASIIGEEFSEEIKHLYNMNNISMIDSPLVPTTPSNSSSAKEVLIINGGGLMASLMFIFMWFYFDNTIKTSEQVEDKTKLPVLGNVPAISKTKLNKSKQEIITYSDPKSPVSEGIRTIRTNLQFSNIDENIKTIMITSSMPGEGKSFISSNTAIAFAQDGHKVLIIDCDMRKGRLHKIFECGNKQGLSNLLLDDIENYEKYIQETDIKNLSLLTSGITPPNPSELLNSEKNKKLIETLEQEFDYIIFDCVPVNGLPDSLIMAKLVDKVMIVCATKETPTELLQKTTKSLQNIDSNIAGIVVNKVKGDYEKYYGHYYG